MSARPPGKNMAALLAYWQALAPRERTMVAAAGALVAAALLWWVALAPALATLRTAPARHATLDTQLQRMLSLQAQAQQLQASTRPPPGDTTAALRTALTQRLGSTAQLNLAGDRATVTLKGAPADALAQWLAQARSNARATLVEARLVRSSASTAPTAPPTRAPLPAPQTAAGSVPLWDGSVVLTVPVPR